MRKDVKIGMVIGLAIAVAGITVFALWPSGNLESKILKADRDNPLQDLNYIPGVGISREEKPAEPAREIPPMIPFEDIPQQPPGGTGLPEYEQDFEITPGDPSEQVNREENRTPSSVTYHVVQENETLSSIAKKYYNDPTQWPRIYKANREVVPNARYIRPGTRLYIPPPP